VNGIRKQPLKTPRKESLADLPSEVSGLVYLVSTLFAELDGDVHLLAAAIDRDVDRVAGALAIQDYIDIELPCDFLAIDGDDDIAANVNAAHAGLYEAIAAANPGSSGRAAGSGDFNEQTFLNRQIQRLAKPAAHGQSHHAEESAMHAAIGDEVVGDAFCRINGDGEADPGSRSAGRIDGGVDADDFTVRIDERAAGVAAIDGRIGLNGFVDEGGLAGLHGAAQGADDAGSERGFGNRKDCRWRELSGPPVKRRSRRERG